MQCWPDDDLPSRITFISDLHLFSNRSTADQHIDLMVAAAESSDLVVFGGDLFDFRWSRVGNATRTTSAAIDWLSQFMASAGNRRYAYLFGNHDGDGGLRRRLAEWSSTRDDFEVAGDLLRVGDIALLHGDAIEGSPTGTDLEDYRMRWANKPQASGVQSRAYDAAVTLRAHRLAAAIAHRRRRTYVRLIRYLTHHQCGPAEGIRRVVFGHTHRYASGRWFSGIQFYNPGATVRGVPFLPVVVSTRDS